MKLIAKIMDSFRDSIGSNDVTLESHFINSLICSILMFNSATVNKC